MSTAASGEQPYQSVRTGDDLPGDDETGLDAPASDAVSQVEVPEIEAGLMEKDITPQAAYLEVGVRSEGASTDEETVEPILSVRHLVKEFPVRSSGVVRRVIGKVQAVSDIGFDLRPGRDARSGGGVGLRQVDHRPHPAASHRAHRRHRHVRGRGPGQAQAGAAAQGPSRPPDRVPGSVRVAQPTAPGQRHRVRAARHPRPPQGHAQGAGARAAQDRGPQPRARQPLPARVLRAASASASASPGPWPSSRRCSCSTSRCRPSTCPSRPAW